MEELRNIVISRNDSMGIYTNILHDLIQQIGIHPKTVMEVSLLEDLDSVDKTRVKQELEHIYKRSIVEFRNVGKEYCFEGTPRVKHLFLIEFIDI